MTPPEAPPNAPSDAAPQTLPGTSPGIVAAAVARPGRLKRRAEFLLAAKEGKRAAFTGLVLQARSRGDDGPVRLGFTVTKKVGNAVIRNRTRRRLRAAAREVLAETAASGVDLVLIGRDGTRGRRYSLLKDDLRRAMTRTGVKV